MDWASPSSDCTDAPLFDHLAGYGYRGSWHFECRPNGGAGTPGHGKATHGGPTVRARGRFGATVASADAAGKRSGRFSNCRASLPARPVTSWVSSPRKCYPDAGRAPVRTKGPAAGFPGTASAARARSEAGARNDAPISPVRLGSPGVASTSGRSRGGLPVTTAYRDGGRPVHPPDGDRPSGVGNGYRFGDTHIPLRLGVSAPNGRTVTAHRYRKASATPHAGGARLARRPLHTPCPSPVSGGRGNAVRCQSLPANSAPPPRRMCRRPPIGQARG